jgi:HEAT repeat protein
LASEEAVRGLLVALKDGDVDVRFYAALNLGHMGKGNVEVIIVLIEALLKAEDSGTRSDAARLLGQIGGVDKAIFDAFWDGLLDEDNGVRSACSQPLVQFSKQNSSTAQELEARLLQALDDPTFEKTDISGEQAYQYVYEALWLLMVGEEDEEGEG